MDVETFRAIHRYGAIASVVAIAGSIVASLVGGPLTPLVLPLGFGGSLGGFYSIGAVLEDHPRYRVLGEELLRGVVWYGGSLFGWALILSESTVLPATPATVLGLPAVTALGLVFVMVGIRRSTGLALKIQIEGGQLLIVVTGVFVGAFVVLYAVLAGNASPLLVVVYAIATIAGLLVWRQRW